MNGDRLEREIGEMLRGSAAVEVPPHLADRIAGIPDRTPVPSSRRTALRGLLLVAAAAVALAAAIAVPRLAPNIAGPAATATATPVRILTAAELQATIAAVQAGTIAPVDVVTDVSMPLIPPMLITTPCGEGATCEQIATIPELGGLKVWMEQTETLPEITTDAETHAGSMTVVVKGPVALHLATSGLVEYLGHVRLAPDGSLVWSVAAALADTASAPAGQVGAVDGWLEGITAGSCGPVQSPMPPWPFGCGTGDVMTSRPQAVATSCGRGCIQTDLPTDGIPVQHGAYDEFAPNPAHPDDFSTEPRHGVYLLRMATYESRRMWVVVGRLDGPGAAATALPSAAATGPGI